MPALRAMVEALIESEQVCINICNGAHEAEAREVLRGLSTERISFYLVPTNEPWCRDHGPIFLTREGVPAPLAVVDWDYNAWGNKYPPFDLDEVAPTRVAEILDVPVFYPGMAAQSTEVPGVVMAFNNPRVYPNLYHSSVRRDGQHLTESGAEEFTRIVAANFVELARAGEIK